MATENIKTVTQNVDALFQDISRGIDPAAKAEAQPAASTDSDAYKTGNSAFKKFQGAGGLGGARFASSAPTGKSDRAELMVATLRSLPRMEAAMLLKQLIIETMPEKVESQIS